MVEPDGYPGGLRWVSRRATRWISGRTTRGYPGGQPVDIREDNPVDIPAHNLGASRRLSAAAPLNYVHKRGNAHRDPSLPDADLATPAVRVRLRRMHCPRAR